MEIIQFTSFRKRQLQTASETAGEILWGLLMLVRDHLSLMDLPYLKIRSRLIFPPSQNISYSKNIKELKHLKFN